MRSSSSYIVAILCIGTLTVLVCIFLGNGTRILRTVGSINAIPDVSAIVELTNIMQFIGHAPTFRNVISVITVIMKFFHLQPQ